MNRFRFRIIRKPVKQRSNANGTPLVSQSSGSSQDMSDYVRKSDVLSSYQTHAVPSDSNIFSSLKAIKTFFQISSLLKSPDNDDPSSDSKVYTVKRSLATFFKLTDIIKSTSSDKMTDDKVLSAKKTDSTYIRKDKDDIASGKVTFKGGVVSDKVQSESFTPGFSGNGYRIGYDDQGNAVAEFDKLVIRKDASFNEVVINQISFTLGATVFSCGGFVVTDVEEREEAYRCYYDNKEGKRYSGMVVGDFARMQIYDASSANIVRYAWREVVAVGDDYVDLSKTKTDGTAVPQEGDNIVQFGNLTDPARQSAVLIDANNGGMIVIYAGINSFNLEGKSYVGMGVDPETGKAYHYVYGTSYIGTRDGLSYVKLTDDGIEVSGKIIVGAGSSGLENIAEWAEKQQQINNAQQSADNAQQAAGDAQQAADNAQAAADEAKAAADKAQTDAVAAQDAADAAQSTADLAKTEAESVNAEVGRIKDDKLVSPVEKPSLTQQLADIKSEYAEILAQANKYGVSSTAYTTAYNKALSALNKYTASTPEYIKVEADYVDIAAYYTARQTILQAIATAAKKVADDAQKAADDAMAAAGEAQNTANAAQSTANDALEKAQAAKDYIDNTLPEEIARINRELDGKVENWYYPYTPTLLNEPAKTWIKDGEQEKHVGDMFFNTQTFVDDETTPDAGKAWKWLKNEEGSYYWKLESNSDAVRALQEAAKAKETADRKSQTFVVQPYPPYSVGDLWMQGSKGDILRCIKSRDTGNFDASDWDKASKYTDDALAQEAKEAAAKAQEDATAAKESARIANEEIGQIKADGVVSPPEKMSLRRQQKDIQSEYNGIIMQADKYSVDKSAYTAAYTAANTALTNYTAETPEYITMGTDFDDIDAYYTARQTILEAINNAAKQYVDDIEQGARNLIAKKYMMEWNRTNAKIIESIEENEYGKYYVLNHAQLYNSIGNVGEKNIFPQFSFEENQQYVFSIKTSMSAENQYGGLIIIVKYTDGSTHNLVLDKAITPSVLNFVTAKNKTVKQISSTYGTSAIKTYIYEIQLTKGNKILNDWIVAPEDAEFTEGVNLVSNKVKNWEQGSLNQSLAVGATWKQLFYSSTKFIRLINPIAVKDVITISSTAKYKFGIAQLDENGLYLGVNLYPLVKNEKFTFYLNEKCRQIGIIVGKADSSDMTLAELSDVHLQVEQGNVASGFKPSPQDVQGEIDGIQVGGTNIFPICKLRPIGLRGESSLEGTGSEMIFKCNAPLNWAIVPVALSTPLVPADTDFIISMDIRNTNVFGMEVTTIDSTDTLIRLTYYTNTSDVWKRIHWKLNSGSKTNIGGINFYGVGEARHIKIEIGNKPTDWIPAPEDVANDAANSIHVGGRNLLKKSNVRKENNSYRIAEYLLAEKITEGTEYTISIKGQLGEDKVQWGIYNSGGNMPLTYMQEVHKDANGVYKRSFNGKLYGANDQIFVYAMESSGTSVSTIEWVKLEYGNKATDWSPAPEDVQQNIDDAIDGLNDTINGAFKDGIIEEAEAIAIAKYLNQVNESFDSVSAEYAVIYASPYLTGTPKTALKTAYDALVTKKNTLIQKINTAIQDGKATVAEKTAVDNAFADYNAAMKSYKTAYENAQKAISDTLKTYSDDANQAAKDAAEAAQRAETNASEAATAIAEMNSDTIFSIVEKQTIRTQWEAISGVSDTTSEPTDKGSYKIAVTQATSAGVSSTELTSYFNALKSQLNAYKLYTNDNTEGFSRTTLSDKFRLYYNAERKLLKAVSDKLVANTDTKAKEDFAKSLGYASWAEWQAAIGDKDKGTIIEDGYIRTSLIKTDGLIAKNIKTSTSGQRIEITEKSNAMKAYDSKGNEILSIKGGFFENTPSSVQNFTMPEKIEKLQYGLEGSQSYFGESTLFPTYFYFGQPGHVVFPTAVLDFKVVNIPVSKLTFNLQFDGHYLHEEITVDYDLRSRKEGAIIIPMDMIYVETASSNKQFAMTLGYASGTPTGTQYYMNMRVRFFEDAKAWLKNTVTEFSKDGFLMNNGASYWQLKRSDKGIEIDSMNVKNLKNGLLAYCSIVSEFSDGVYPNYVVDEARSLITIQVIRTGMGTFKFIHNLKTYMYHVSVIPRSSGKMAYIANKSMYSCTVTITNSSGSAVDANFDFMLHML